MLIKVIILSPLLYFSALLESSFLPHFAILGHILSLIFILTILSVFFVPSISLFTAFFGGIYLDVFSTNFLGGNALVLVGTVIFIRLTLKRYVKIPVR